MARGNSVFLGLRALDWREASKLVPLEAVAEVLQFSSGPEPFLHRERERVITVPVSPPPKMPLEEAQERIQTMVIDPLVASGALAGGYQLTLGGTADKLRATWDALWFNLVIAGLITYLLIAALFESWFYPAVIITAVPLGSIGGLVVSTFVTLVRLLLGLCLRRPRAAARAHATWVDEAEESDAAAVGTPLAVGGR